MINRKMPIDVLYELLDGVKHGRLTVMEAKVKPDTYTTFDVDNESTRLVPNGAINYSFKVMEGVG